ncbi:helix-turn-helix domain-containing protein, partial [Aerococcus urinae]
MSTPVLPPRNPQAWLSVQDAAKLLSLSAKTVRKMCQEGALKATKFGWVWRIRPDAIEAHEREKAAAFDESAPARIAPRSARSAAA